MNRYRKLAVLSFLALSAGLAGTVGSVAAAPALGSQGFGSAAAYDYDPSTRADLIARRSAFDPSDGLKRWERRLLAMDPNGSANVGR